MSEFESFRQEIEAILTLIDEANLGRVEQDELAEGIRRVRNQGKTFADVAAHLLVKHQQTFVLGERLLNQLSDADDALEDEQVEKLDALVAERLPPTI